MQDECVSACVCACIPQDMQKQCNNFDCTTVFFQNYSCTKTLRYREKYIHCCVLSYRTLNRRNLSYLKSGAFEYIEYFENLVRVSLVWCFSSVGFNYLCMRIILVCQAFWVFFCCFHFKHWGNTDDEEWRCKYRRRREVSRWCENDFAYLVLSWKVHDTQEQLSLSFSLALFFPFIFSFTHPPCPFFSRHHSEGVLLRHPHAGEWAHSKWLVMHINSHYYLRLQAETLEIPCHFSSLMDNSRSARRFRLEKMDLDAKLEFFFLVFGCVCIGS